MSKLAKICQICLRADRKVNGVDSKFSEFHDELCDYSVMMDPKYCYECEYLLKKLYKFKSICSLANKIIKNEKKKKGTEKMSIDLLYTLLPSMSLQFWSPTNTRVYTIDFEDNPNENMMESPISNTNIMAQSISYENRTGLPNLDTVGPPISNVNTKGPPILNVNTMGPPISNVNIMGPPISNINTMGPPISNINTMGPPILNEKTMSPPVLNVNTPEMSNLINSMDGSNSHIVLLPVENILTEDSKNHIKDQLHIEDTNLSKPEIKQEVYYNVPIDEHVSEDDATLKIEITHLEENDIDMSTETKSKIKLQKAFDEIFSESEDSSSNIDLSDEDMTYTQNSEKDSSSEDSDGQSNGKKKICDKKDDKKRVIKGKTRDKDGKTSRVRKVTGKNVKVRERFHTKRGLLAELASLDDSEDEVLRKVKMRRSKLPFTKGRLLAELTEKFASCGEVKASGITIDKEFIIECLHNKVTDFVMRQLWSSLHGKHTFRPKALKLFKSIQNKYKNDYDSVFDIEYLNTKEKMLEEFHNRKTYDCYVNAEFKCELCYTGFKHEKKLEYHMKCHDESAGELICPICNVRQKHKKSLINHMNSHEAVYKCKLCPLITYYKGSMVNHYQQHNGVKFRCEQCDTTFGSRSAYATHLSYRHARRHVCTVCGRAFSSETGLKGHKTRLHQNEPASTDSDKTVNCNECSLSFPSEEVYQRHVRITHERPTRGRKPGSIVANNPHRVYRPRKVPVVTCRVCNDVGNSIGWLNMHFRTEHPDKDIALTYADKWTHLCHICGKGFSTVYTLRNHLNGHSGLRPYSCSACPARFPRALALRLHRALHAPPARPCAHCGKVFRSHSNLANHVRFHVGDRRYKCKICGKGFLHRCTLNEHVKGVHHHVRRVRKRGGVAAGGTGAGVEVGGTGENVEMGGHQVN